MFDKRVLHDAGCGCGFDEVPLMTGISTRRRRGSRETSVVPTFQGVAGSHPSNGELIPKGIRRDC